MQKRLAPEPRGKTISLQLVTKLDRFVRNLARDERRSVASTVSLVIEAEEKRRRGAT